MRTLNSVKNSIISVLSYSLAILIGFIAQKIFVSILNTEYLGINGLFTNILTILSIAELGIGESIIFHLYKPVDKKDENKINQLLLFYKKAYNIISLFVLIFGLLLIPFLKYFIGDTTLEINMIVVYILFLLQTVSSYMLTYKRSIIYANQKNYIVNIIHVLYLFVLNIVQLAILYFTNNYYIYLIIKIVCTIMENITINIIANKLYPYICNKNIDNIDKETQKDILKRIKAQLFHKIGSAIVNGTDNIVISKFINVFTVGLYSNYYLIINSVKNLFVQLISSLTASVGNLLIEDNKEKNFEVYKKVRFLNFWIATFAGTSLLILIQTFIEIWMGKEYLLSTIIIIVLIINFYQKLMRSCNDTFMIAAGICIENRFVPLIESILNIIFSIIFVKLFGLAGVFLGTIVSGLALWCYSYPKFCYKKLFDRTYKEFFKETVGYFFIFTVISVITYIVTYIINIQNIYILFGIKVIIAIIVPNMIMVGLFKNTENYKYFISILNKIKSKTF